MNKTSAPMTIPTNGSVTPAPALAAKKQTKVSKANRPFPSTANDMAGLVRKALAKLVSGDVSFATFSDGDRRMVVVSHSDGTTFKLVLETCPPLVPSWK